MVQHRGVTERDWAVTGGKSTVSSRKCNNKRITPGHRQTCLKTGMLEATSLGL